MTYSSNNLQKKGKIENFLKGQSVIIPRLPDQISAQQGTWATSWVDSLGGKLS